MSDHDTMHEAAAMRANVLFAAASTHFAMLAADIVGRPLTKDELERYADGTTREHLAAIRDDGIVADLEIIRRLFDADDERTLVLVEVDPAEVCTSPGSDAAQDERRHLHIPPISRVSEQLAGLRGQLMLTLRLRHADRRN